jgi:hypothetical protein
MNKKMLKWKNFINPENESDRNADAETIQYIELKIPQRHKAH